ncbi:hypothetical protein ZIOFF_028729 [Zingiber officinale]|uniref:Tetratricopeptide repeat protein SKI3 n=1 Tax=Zingiber officinale TaxID=94328 RepID=A0A8J5GSI1_ZINOF|nr:hypothetical protein ZIOFF_028729 [Zingiber officinale]
MEPEVPTMSDKELLMKLQEALSSDPDNPRHHYDLGMYLWERAEAMELSAEQVKQLKEKAAEHFLASAKLNPSNGPAFRFLGHYYREVSVDAQRSVKCYQRAVALDSNDSEAGDALCDLLDGEGKESLEMAVCKESSEKSPRAFWAFRRLGYLQIHQRRWSEAVPNLQHAIRGYPACADLWEVCVLITGNTCTWSGIPSFRHVYCFSKGIGCFNAISYGRAIELEESRIFALVESGYIHTILGSFRKGVEQFQFALQLAPHNISVNLGLASALLGWSKECVKSGAFVWAADLLREALEATETSTSLSGNLFSAWKLQGDIQIAYANCIPWENEKKGYDVDEEIFKLSIVSWKKERNSAANSSKHSYQRALHLAPWQANIYTDIAISIELIDSLEETNKDGQDAWQLPEKMALGGLMLEGGNKEFWVLLGCLASNDALKQHSLIRALQLDLSLSSAWAHLGKLYRSLGEKQLASEAFDHARSIDPSLALPWAGMSSGFDDGLCSANEAYESCLWAVQILPLAEFQIGLGVLAVLSGHELSPQVFGAIQQAVHRAPFSSLAHNLLGLVCESRTDYQSAVIAYQQARYILKNFPCFEGDVQARFVDVSVNLARSLCKICVHLLSAGLPIKYYFCRQVVQLMLHTSVIIWKKKIYSIQFSGFLDGKGLQIYAVALWNLGQNNRALTVVRKLAENISTMKQTSANAALGLICTLVYNISGCDSVVATISKLPSNLLQITRMSLIVCALNALDTNNRLQLLLPTISPATASHGIVSEMHSLTAISKMITCESDQSLAIGKGVNYLKKALHMYPNNNLLSFILALILPLIIVVVLSHPCTEPPLSIHRHCYFISFSSASEDKYHHQSWFLASAATAFYFVTMHACHSRTLAISSPLVYVQSTREAYLSSIFLGLGCRPEQPTGEAFLSIKPMSDSSSTSSMPLDFHVCIGFACCRCHLGSLLLSSEDWIAPAKASRCTVIPTGSLYPVKKGFKLPHEIHGAAAVACHSLCSTNPKFSFPTCDDCLMHGARSLPLLQRWLHQEPWNQNARYLLILNLLQKAREEKFPQQLCITLKHLVSDAIYRENLIENNHSHSRHFLLLLCASELSLQSGDPLGCIRNATDALSLLPTSSDSFFAHLQLCRAYAMQQDFSNLRNEYANCLQTKTLHPMGWLSLKYLASRYSLQKNSDIIDANFYACATTKGSSFDHWIANFELVSAQCYMWDQEYLQAEQALTRACAANTNSCLLLCHGAICMELARRQAGPQFVSAAISSLMKAQNNSPTLLPIVSLLLAQAEASFGAKTKWEKHLQHEWFAWPEEMRPAELYFQMHLLAKQSNSGSIQDPGVASSQSPERWIQRAIHLNPSCSRYWKVLHKVIVSY